MLRLPIALAFLLSAGTLPAQAPNLINRLACAVVDTESGVGLLTFTDAESGALTSFPFPNGFKPGHLIAMDHYGDVWLSDRNTSAIRKFSGSTGALLATAVPMAPPSYIVTDAQANLIVGSADPPPAPQSGAGVYVERFTPAGALIAGVDLRSLFPPGVFVPFHTLGATPWFMDFQGGIPRILVTRSGALWLIVPDAGHTPVLRLNPDLTLAAAYGLYYPGSILPDDDEGAWIRYLNYPHPSFHPQNPPLMPGALQYGWIHLSGSGQILESTTDGLMFNAYIFNGHIRRDGREFRYPDWAGSGQPYIAVHMPGSGPVPWYQWEHRIDFGPSLSVFPWLAAFHLDGAQRLWVLRHTGEMFDPVLGIYRAPRVRWTRYPLEPPYSDLLHVPLGELFLSVPLAGISWYRASYHGSASLYEYVAYTDPHGDLDGDGVPNDVELASFSNPLLPYGFSPVATATGSGLAPGSVFSVTYSIPGDQGLAYAAPFALLGAFPHHFGGGWFIPVMFQDPLLQLSLQPNVPGLSGTLGVLDGQGMTTAAIAIPPIPGLSGFTFHSCIVTRDPNLPIPFKTVSRAFEWTIP